MWGREALKRFKEASWESQDDLAAYIESITPLPPGDVERLLAMLVDRRLSAQGHLHRNRCAVFGAIAERSLDQALFGPFVRAVEAGDALVRRTLSPLIPRINDVSHHEQLCRLLGSESSDVRRTAAELLKEIGGPSALGHLTRLVRQRNFAGRTEAMDVMVPKARHRAIPLLASILESGTPRERVRALRYLSEGGLAQKDPAPARSAVRKALTDADRRVVSEAFKAFGLIVGEDEFFDELEGYIFALDVDPALIESLGAYRSQRALDVLEHKIRIGPNAVRLAAIEALRRMQSPQAATLLVDALHVDDVAVRKRATEVLVELGRSGTIDAARIVLELLRSTSPDVRRIAAHVARSVGDESGTMTPRLLTFLKDEDWWVRERVMDALVEMAGEELTEHIVPYLEDESPVIRRFAIGGLIRLRDAASLGAILRSAVEDEDWWVREQAVQACAELRDPRAIPYLKKIALERPDLRVASLEALHVLGAHAELLELAELAGDEDADVRHAVLKCLRDVPDGAQASFYVQACVGDADPRVQRLARELLTQWEVKVEKEAIAASLGLLDRLLVAAVRAGADDLLLAAGRPPYVKRLGAMEPISRGTLSEQELVDMIRPGLSKAQLDAFANGRDVDFSYEVRTYELRFRVNLFRQVTGVAAVFRNVRQEVPDIDTLGLPETVKGFARLRQGLVLVGGPTGSGKSTTLAALIDHINRRDSLHVVTIEDPVEVVHKQKESLINQREVGTDARSFAHALRSTLRQDPDVILVGELRDLETIDFAVNAAETGHLVLGTVHTVSADTSVDRIVHAYPASQQPLVRSMLAESLRAVVCQQLLRRVDDPDQRALAAEVMINNDAISNLIRKNKTFQVGSVIATHREQGMMLMDFELERLVKGGLVSPEEALMKSVDKNAFASMLVTSGYLEEAEALASIPPSAPGQSKPPSGPPTSMRPSSSRPPAPQPSAAPRAPSSYAGPGRSIPAHSNPSGVTRSPGKPD